MSDYLPNEVLVDILVRVPVKSLLRFRCVSKKWNSLISSPAFINTHLNRALFQQTNGDDKSNQDLLLFRYYYSIDYVMEDDHGMHISVNDKREEDFSLHMDDESFPHNPYLKLDFPYSCGGWYKDYFQIEWDSLPGRSKSLYSVEPFCEQSHGAALCISISRSFCHASSWVWL